MISNRFISFLVLGGLFATTHWFAMVTDSYSYYWWLDIVMHFWGGALILLAWYNLAVFPRLYAHVFPTLPRVLLVLLVITVGWEVFEKAAGVWQPAAYWIDTMQDIANGFAGGLLTYFFLRTGTIKKP